MNSGRNAEANWKTLQTEIKDSNNQTVKSRSSRHKTLDPARSIRNVKVEVNRNAKPTNEDKIMRLAALT